MKTTKKDWIYRVILLILLAIIWDIGAALTSPIFVPQKSAVFREFFLLIQNGTMLKAFRYSLIRITAAAVLNDFVNIAKTLDGTMIVINGNINADSQTEFGVQLSANRAQTVANYLASQGIDQSRLIVTGSGNAKYQADKAAGTLSGDASVYQSTDISFMRIEN